MESHLIVFCIVLTILTTSFAIVFWKCLNSEIEFLKAMSAMTLLFFFLDTASSDHLSIITHLDLDYRREKL